jgi:EAL domain-containing protein (putative c-di-GMP-specific phosphodiesterase class I)
VLADGLVEAVQQALAESGVAPRALVLQVAGGQLTDVAPVVPVLRRLHGLGVALAVDDFGGPGCSLAQLRQLPLDAITLDPDLLSDGDAAALLEAVVALAARLGVRAVAAGVRTPEQWALLRRVGCPMGKTPPDAALLPADVPAVLDRWRPTG